MRVYYFYLSLSLSFVVPELQGESLEEIAREKAQLAWEQLKTTEGCEGVLIEDTALGFDALNGLPGAYIKWFLAAAGRESLCRMLDGFGPEGRGASATCTLVLATPSQLHLFSGVTRGSIAMHPQGPIDSFGWDPIFLPDGSGGRSYAQMSAEEKNSISHRSRALAQLRSYLES